MTTITLCGATPAWQVPAAYVVGTVAVHRPPLNTSGDLSKSGWRLTHLPSGAKIWDCHNYRMARAIAKALGNDPLFGDALRMNAPKVTRVPAWNRLLQVIAAAERRTP